MLICDSRALSCSPARNQFKPEQPQCSHVVDNDDDDLATVLLGGVRHGEARERALRDGLQLDNATMRIVWGLLWAMGPPNSA